MKDRSKAYKTILILLAVICFIALSGILMSMFFYSIDGFNYGLLCFNLNELPLLIVPLRAMFAAILISVAGAVVLFKAKFTAKQTNKFFAAICAALVVVTASTAVAFVRCDSTSIARMYESQVSDEEVAAVSEEAQKLFPYYKIDKTNIKGLTLSRESSDIATSIYAKGSQNGTICEIEYIKTSSPIVHYFSLNAKHFDLDRRNYEAVGIINENTDGVNVMVYEYSNNFIAVIDSYTDIFTVNLTGADKFDMDAQVFAETAAAQYNQMRTTVKADTFFGAE